MNNITNIKYKSSPKRIVNIKQVSPKRALAVLNNTTMYPGKIESATLARKSGLIVLKPASYNRKLSGGKDDKGIITKGPAIFRGKPLFSLTLTERETCPRDCKMYVGCYGNSSFRSVRYKHDDNLEAAIESDLEYLAANYPGGIVVRLHVLGDFVSPSYTAFWCRMLRKFENLNVFGYTHWKHGTPIGDAVRYMVQGFPGRAAIMRSDKEDSNDPLPGAYVVEPGQTPNPNIVVCPQQTGKTKSCLTCALCMNGRTEIQFMSHGGITL